MTKPLNYKKKNQLLIAIMIIAVLVIYKLSLVRTIEKYNDFRTIRSKINTVSMIPDEINDLQQKISKINRFFGTESDSMVNKRELLIDFTSNYAEKSSIALRLISEPNYEYRENILIESNQMTLQGPFVGLVKYVDGLENNQKIGKIASLHFYKEKNIRTKNEKLFLKVFIQNIINQSNENKKL